MYFYCDKINMLRYNKKVEQIGGVKMKIQKGLVKYKERSDIICTYGITDDGKQYYFLNDTKLANNNIIVSTTLVEAVDPNVVRANVGVVNENGDIVIACDNRSIRLVTNNILLVEKANPTSPSVVDAVKCRKDPLAATKLVSTPSVIKDKIFAAMGDTGKFIFNDQFSEASLFDIDGKNLLNDKYYSFIAINKKEDTIYLCYNTKESNVDVYTIATGELVDNNVSAPVEGEQAIAPETAVVPEAPVAPEQTPVELPAVPDSVGEGVAPIAPEVPATVEQPVTEGVQSELQTLGTDTEPVQPVTPDNIALPTAEEMAAVQDVQVEENKYTATVSEPAVDQTAPVEEVPQTNEMVIPEAPVVPEPEQAVVPEVPVEPEVPLTDLNPVQPDVDLGNMPVDITVPEADNSALVNPAVEENVEPVTEQPVETPVEETPVEVSEEVPVENEIVIPETPAVEEEAAPVEEEQAVEENPEVEETTEVEESIPVTPPVVEEENAEEEEPYTDIEKIDDEEDDSDINQFLNGNDEEEDDDYEERDEDMSIDTDYYSSNDKKTYNSNIMNNAASTISKLIETNKNQKDEIDEYRNQVKELNNLNKKVVEKAKREKEKTRTSIQNYEIEIEKLKSQMDDLESTIRDKESKLNSQQKELSELRDQLQGTRDLEKALKDAESLLGN